QAEDGIRDRNVTGVQTCALPISARRRSLRSARHGTRRRSPRRSGETPPGSCDRPWPAHSCRPCSRGPVTSLPCLDLLTTSWAGCTRRTGLASRIMISNDSAHRAHDWRRTAMNTVATATRTLPASSQRIAPEKFAHVVLKTANYDAVITWYATVLQARVAFRNDVIAFLTYDDEHHRVAVINT